MGADAIGVLDPTPFTDTVNGLLYLLRDKPEEAMLSFAGIIPFIGDAAKLGKHLKRGAEAAEKLKPVVIGENMRGRVVPYAQKIGGTHINDFIPSEQWTRELNREWIEQMMRERRRIIDIGPDFGRRRKEKYISLPYEMERKYVKGYPQYVKVFRRYGKWWGGVPGLD